MRRFNYDDSDDKDEVDKFHNFDDGDDDDDDDDDDDEVYMSEADFEEMLQHNRNQEALALLEMELVAAEMDQKLLSQAIRMCERQWFWSFKSWPTRIKQIAKTYMALERILLNAQDRKQKEK